MKSLSIIMLTLAVAGACSCSSPLTVMVEDKVLFTGYGVPREGATTPLRMKESAQQAALLAAQAKYTEATSGKVFDFGASSLNSSSFAGVARGGQAVKYKILTPYLAQCLMLVDLSRVNFGTWGATRRLSFEMSYKGDFESAPAADVARFLGSVEAKTMEVIRADAQANNYIKDNKLSLQHVYVLHDIQDNGSVKGTIVYAVP